MRIAKNIVTLAILFAATASRAAITITDVTGASNFIASSGKIFGGSAGVCSVVSTTSTCNSCEGTDFSQACNLKRIHPDLVLTISIKSDSSIAGKVILTDSTGNTPINNTLGSSITQKDQVGTLQIAWLYLCNTYITMDTTSASLGTCMYNGTGQFKIGIDKDNNGQLSTGDESLSIQIRLQNTMGVLPTHIDGCSDASAGDPLCGFGVLPGDEKVYVVADQLRYVTGYPSGPNINYTHLRLYYVEGPGPDYDPLFFATFPITRANEPVTLATSGSGDAINLDDDVVPNLINGARYYFLAATVDEAQNEGFYSVQSSLSGQHSAKPDEVFGLLSSDFQCFVATAAYGTPMMKEVVTLRRFRGYLLENYRAISYPFIKFYYKVSPPLAQFIARHNSLRAVSRVMLWPAVLFAQSSLTRGLPTTLFISILFLLISAFVVQQIYRWRKSN